MFILVNICRWHEPRNSIANGDRLSRINFTKYKSSFRTLNVEFLVYLIYISYNPHHYRQGVCAEMCAKAHQISREEQDEFAALSYRRSQAAGERGVFRGEIVPVTVQPKKGICFKLQSVH